MSHSSKKEKRQLRKKHHKYDRYNESHGRACADQGAGTIVTCSRCLRQAGRCRNYHPFYPLM